MLWTCHHDLWLNRNRFFLFLIHNLFSLCNQFFLSGSHNLPSALNDRRTISAWTDHLIDYHVFVAYALATLHNWSRISCNCHKQTSFMISDERRSASWRHISLENTSHILSTLIEMVQNRVPILMPFPKVQYSWELDTWDLNFFYTFPRSITNITHDHKGWFECLFQRHKLHMCYGYSCLSR